MSTIVLALSIVLQFSAAIGAFRLIKLTGHLWVWSLIAAALTLMGVRRSITFYWAVAGDVPQSPELIAELVALFISLLMVIGVFRIKPLLVQVGQSTKALQQSREDFKAFAEVSSDFFWAMDDELRFTYFSEAFSSVTGVRPETLLGRTRREVGAPGAEPEALQQHLRDLDERRPFWEFVHTRTNNRGETVFVSISGKPVFDDHGEFAGYRGIGRDISAQVRAEADLATSLEEAQRANMAKSEFLAKMSHELRTPLNAIIGFADLIGGASPQKREGRHLEYAGYISDAGNSLLYLVNDLLDLSRIEAGKLDLVETEADLVELLESCIVDVVGTRSHESMKLVSSLEAQTVVVKVDPVRIRQIFNNLLSNAIKFTPETGQVTLTLGRSDDGGAIVTVSDTGPGIDQDDMEKVFDPFHQAGDVLRRKQEGAGLGLSIVKALVDLHGGSLSVESRVGQGTAVHVTLPAERCVSFQAGLRSVV